MTDVVTATADAVAASPRATAVRATVAALMDQVVAAIAAGSYPDGIPADLSQTSQTATYKAKQLRAAG
jgi:hypothetical protein